MYKLGYLNLLENGELERRVNIFKKMLSNCVICPHQCQVNRLKGLKIPIIYNTNGYDFTDTLKFLDGIIDIYMPDIKFSDDDLKTDKKNIAYKGLLIRHLVLPENWLG
ncbi:MAG: hypothetical protein KAX49_14655 [Halanaerobiales bacterium]|nr:hypothetical protein [Halanaerobiales bacterium]